MASGALAVRCWMVEAYATAGLVRQQEGREGLVFTVLGIKLDRAMCVKSGCCRARQAVMEKGSKRAHRVYEKCYWSLDLATFQSEESQLFSWLKWREFGVIAVSM